jgi:hypothetical protein
VNFISPGKTVYRTQKSVEAVLVSRNLDDCFHDQSYSSAKDATESDSDYTPLSEVKSESTTKKRELETEGIIIERRMFACESTQLVDFVEQINATSKCSTLDFDGKGVNYNNNNNDFIAVFPPGGFSPTCTFNLHTCIIRYRAI